MTFSTIQEEKPWPLLELCVPMTSIIAFSAALNKDKKESKVMRHKSIAK